MVSNSTIWPSELDQNGFTGRYLTYHTGRDQRVPPFNFFRHCETFFFGFFFRNFFSSKGPLCIFLMFCDRMDVGKSQRVPPFSFFGIVRFSPENENKKNFFFNFFMFCDRMDVEKPQRVPPFSFSAL